MSCSTAAPSESADKGRSLEEVGWVSRNEVREAGTVWGKAEWSGNSGGGRVDWLQEVGLWLGGSSGH